MSANVSDETHQQLAAEVTQRSEKRERSIRQAQDLYERWCAANQLDRLPADDAVASQQLLRFMHSCYEAQGWAWSTCREYGIAVAELFTRAGHSDPRNGRYDAWRNARRREQGGTRIEQPVDALEPDQVIAAATEPQPPAAKDEEVTRLRALVTVAKALGWSPVPAPRGRDIHRLPGSAFEVRDDAVVIRTETARGLVSREEDPVGFECVTAVLASGAELPLVTGGGAEGLAAAALLTDDRHLREAWQRAFWKPYSQNNRVLVEFLGACDDAEWAWWRRCIDENVPLAVLDRAYVLLGAQQGHRHATLARLTVGHFEEDGAGFRYVVRVDEDKGLINSRAQGGRARELERVVPHQDPDGDRSRCGLVCAACALDDLLQARRHAGAADERPLFVVVKGTTEAPSYTTMGRRMRNLFGPGEQPPGQRISTRSLRVTAASLARSSGLSLVEIAHHLGHQKPASVEPYLRWSPADGTTYVLETGAAEEPA